MNQSLPILYYSSNCSISEISALPADSTPSFLSVSSLWNFDRCRAPESHRIVTTTGGLDPCRHPRCFFNFNAVRTAATQFTAEEEPRNRPSLGSIKAD